MFCCFYFDISHSQHSPCYTYLCSSFLWISNFLSKHYLQLASKSVSFFHALFIFPVLGISPSRLLIFWIGISSSKQNLRTSRIAKKNAASKFMFFEHNKHWSYLVYYNRISFFITILSFRFTKYTFYLVKLVY